ncbi:zinc finger CCCH domain-containing protein 14-like [Salvia splendens]|uniref:zinc finger CCCH domain-containing protein 14-like n=1 Tax=Salvia splendens TaxID=180675 RepID=UPI001C2754B6|nr:zinc finger CCCH domain-containing protein 14-like [Salvia splendens]XP_041997657.1 zinc finger CCCH domain-containing protein 14-like [Salvia splendens]
MDSRKRGRPESSYGGASKKSKTDSVSLFLPTTPHYTSRISAFSRISQFIFFVIGYKAVPGAIKTKMCIKFKTEGGCMFGDKCSFAHGERELIAPSDRGGVDLCLAGLVVVE